MVWLFSRLWLAAIGKTEAEVKSGNTVIAYGGAFSASYMTAYVLALFIGLGRMNTPLQGALIGLWAWVGFVAAPNLPTYLFSRWSRELFLINNGYHLVTFLIMGVILGAWT